MGDLRLGFEESVEPIKIRKLSLAWQQMQKKL